MPVSTRFVPISSTQWTPVAEDATSITLKMRSAGGYRLYVGDAAPADNAIDYVTMTVDDGSVNLSSETPFGVWAKAFSGSQGLEVLEQ